MFVGHTSCVALETPISFLNLASVFVGYIPSSERIHYNANVRFCSLQESGEQRFRNIFSPKTVWSLDRKGKITQSFNFLLIKGGFTQAYCWHLSASCQEHLCDFSFATSIGHVVTFSYRLLRSAKNVLALKLILK